MKNRTPLSNIIFRRDALDRCTKRDGVFSFVDGKSDFYEGAYGRHISYVPRIDRWPVNIPIWMLSNGYVWETRRQVKPGSTVLEMGCASGVAYFGIRYRMVGLDISLSALSTLREHYEVCVHASALETLPFLDDTFDAIVSSFFWEHLSELEKGSLVRELARILKPGGKVIFLYDVETFNPLISYFRRKDPALYQKLFIDGDGHLGYHSCYLNDEIFSSAGFESIKKLGLEKSPFQSLSVFEKLRQWELGRKIFPRLKRLNKEFFYAYTLFNRVLNLTVDRLLPRSWARIELVVFRK